MSDLLLHTLFSIWGSPVTVLEALAFVLSLLMVVGNVHERMWAWPLAITTSVLYGWLFWRSRLYGQVGLQIVFAALAAWGWWQWRFGQRADGAPLRPTHLPQRELRACVLATLLLWPLLGALLRWGTDSPAPWADAFPTAASLVAQWLLARKYVENWAGWAIVNTASIGLFVWQQLWLTALLYALFLAMSFWGWRAWQRQVQGPAMAAASA